MNNFVTNELKNWKQLTIKKTRPFLRSRLIKERKILAKRLLIINPHKKSITTPSLVFPHFFQFEFRARTSSNQSGHCLAPVEHLSIGNITFTGTYTRFIYKYISIYKRVYTNSRPTEVRDGRITHTMTKILGQGFSSDFQGLFDYLNDDIERTIIPTSFSLLYSFFFIHITWYYNAIYIYKRKEERVEKWKKRVKTKKTLFFYLEVK